MKYMKLAMSHIMGYSDYDKRGPGYEPATGTFGEEVCVKEEFAGTYLPAIRKAEQNMEQVEG